METFYFVRDKYTYLVILPWDGETLDLLPFHIHGFFPSQFMITLLLRNLCVISYFLRYWISTTHSLPWPRREHWFEWGEWSKLRFREKRTWCPMFLWEVHVCLHVPG